MDFSAFSTLHLELKGEQGNETVGIHVKDADYPDDREPISVELLLSNEWQSYEISLDELPGGSHALRGSTASDQGSS